MSILLILVSWLVLCSSQFIDDIQSLDKECLGEDIFMCMSGGCIPQNRYCDGNYDCEDGSDENFCISHRPDEQYCNETHQFLCVDGLKCLPSAWVCNDEADCADGSDEANCPIVTPDNVNATCKGFVCDGKKCISKFWKCDGYYDCTDKTDEIACRNAQNPKTLSDMYLHDISFCEYRGRYICVDQFFCLPSTHMCDGLKDCKDGSDEGAFCENWSTMCNNFTCPDKAVCQPQRTGATCICPTYKKYNTTTKLCDDKDQCKELKPVCSHMCVDKGGHYQCECDAGYTPDEAKYLCFAPDPEPLLFFNTRTDIRYVSLKSKRQVIAVSNVRQAHAVSYDGEYLYWMEIAQGHQSIMRGRLGDIKDTKEVIAALGLEDPGDIAIDYLGDNIYFSDVRRGIISACRSDGSACTTLQTNAKHPRFVTLDPHQGKMYWVDWHDKEVIMQANMDGSNAEVLVDKLRSVTTGLALDSPNGRLYFVDQTIKVVRLDDKRIYPFFEEPFHHPYSLAVFENTLYWSDFTSNTIQTSDKVHGTQIKRNILLKLGEPVFDMHIYHPVLMQKKENPCSHHDCSICLLTSNETYTCACPDDMLLVGDQCQHTPGYRRQYLIVGAGGTFTRVHYNSIGNPETHGTVLDIGRVQSMAYDSLRDVLYVYDGRHKSINYINMNDFSLGVTKLLLYKGLGNVVDMDYDFVSDTLYVLDAGRSVIDVVSLRNKYSALLYTFKDREIPVSMCVMSDQGRMLVAVLKTEENNKVYIDSIGLDGSNREHVLMNNIVGPNVRLRYLPEMNVVFIADEGNNAIEVIHPEGSGRELFTEVLTPVASLAVSDTHVFWTDRRSYRLYWANLHEVPHQIHHIRRMELSIFPNQTHMHVLTTTLPPDDDNPYRQHKCFQDPTPCSHICVQAPHWPPNSNNVSSMGYTCRCPPGFLTFDQCMEFVECRPEEFYCHKSIECFAADKKCDGVFDCKQGEDEEGCDDNDNDTPDLCPADQTNCNGVCILNTIECNDNVTTSTPEPLKCSSDEFRCWDNSVCIERSLACDGHSDCADGSDEQPDACDVRSCLPTEFMCAIGKCIPIAWKCDRSVDCPDGSDEVGCDRKACPEGSFKCDNGTCVEVYKRCDGKSDCLDHADEEDCDLTEFIDVTNAVVTCSPWEHPCEHNKTMCLPLTTRCNGKVDCPGGTDEDGCDYHCGGIGSDMYPCRQEYKCVKKSRVCNGRRDCSDGSDETLEACMKVNKTIPIHPVHVVENCTNGYQCNNKQCVEWPRVCDNTLDCLDASDEGRQCNNLCKYGACQHLCHPTPRGPMCTCFHGYVSHGSTCIDVDECEHRPCSHTCHNLPGSFVCACHKGYGLRADRRSCKALRGRFSVVYTQGSSLWALTNHVVNIRLHSHNGTFGDLDVDVRNRKVYVASNDSGHLLQVNLFQKQPTVDVMSNIGIPDRVALDWITGNVYFVDASPASYMRVCNFRQKRCSRLQRLPSNANVTALAIDPANRLMFYCVSEGDEASVRSASLSGRIWAILATVNGCTGLAVDSFSRIVYVASERPPGIVELNYDGTPNTVLHFAKKTFLTPRDLALFEDHVYFLSNYHLSRCMLFATKNCDSFDHYINATHFAIRHESTQRTDVINVCEPNACAHMCVLGQVKPECVCHDGSVMISEACPKVEASELPIFNGVGPPAPEAKSHSLTYALVISVLVLFVVYLAIFVYYHFYRKRNSEEYLQVRYITSPESGSSQPTSNVEMPEAIVHSTSSSSQEYMKPLRAMRDYWQQSFYKKKPIGTAGLSFDTQQDLSDTESDLDGTENKAMNT